MGFPLVDVRIVKPESAPADCNEYETKPRWLSCMAFTMSAVTIIICSISLGMIIGYSYCYFEHRTEFLQGNYTGIDTTMAANDMMTELPFDANRTINGALQQALMHSVLIGKIVDIVRQATEDTAPYEQDDQVMRMTNLWDVFPVQVVRSIEPTK